MACMHKCTHQWRRARNHAFSVAPVNPALDLLLRRLTGVLRDEACACSPCGTLLSGTLAAVPPRSSLLCCAERRCTYGADAANKRAQHSRQGNTRPESEADGVRAWQRRRKLALYCALACVCDQHRGHRSTGSRSYGCSWCFWRRAGSPRCCSGGELAGIREGEAGTRGTWGVQERKQPQTLSQPGAVAA